MEERSEPSDRRHYLGSTEESRGKTEMSKPSETLPSEIPALLPRGGSGHQFVCYADSCSGMPGTPEEAAFAGVNAVVSRLRPQPEFISFPGDEIIGLSTDEETLRGQWRYWFDEELHWLDRQEIPLYHTTGNHTAYDPVSERVFKDVLAHLPRNGPPGQEGLSYFVRRKDLLLIFVNTLWSRLGGEGHVETTWLDKTLSDNADARFKLVFGHHPVHPVNGRVGPHELTIVPEDGREFWKVLVKHGVSAYACSHLLTFDVQVHEGVLQILTAGAGRARGCLHCLQVALDEYGLRYQVLDTSGAIKGSLNWPPCLPPSETWARFGVENEPVTPPGDTSSTDAKKRIVVWGFSGISASPECGEAQTLLSGWDEGTAPAPLWIGLLGRERRFAVLLSPAPGRSPNYWLGPPLASSETFEIQLAFHTGMGPEGVLWRKDDASPWSSLTTASSRGLEQLNWFGQWGIGHDKRGATDRPFLGRKLRVTWHTQAMQLDEIRSSADKKA